MNTLKNKKLRKSIKLLAYYEIIGGILGLIVLTYFVSVTSPILLPQVLIITIGGILFILSIISGQQLLEKNPKRGLMLSTVTQLLQLVSFAVSGYSFLFVSGLMLSVGIELTNSFEITSSFSLSELDINYNHQHDLIFFKINIVAVFLLVGIEKIKSELNAISIEEEET